MKYDATFPNKVHPTPGMPGGPGMPDERFPGGPGMPDERFPGGPGIPDNRFSGGPGIPDNRFPGGPVFPGLIDDLYSGPAPPSHSNPQTLDSRQNFDFLNVMKSGEKYLHGKSYFCLPSY